MTCSIVLYDLSGLSFRGRRHRYDFLAWITVDHQVTCHDSVYRLLLGGHDSSEGRVAGFHCTRGYS